MKARTVSYKLGKLFVGGSLMSIGIYVHIPFCRSKCGYCDFNSLAGMFERQEEYVDCLIREISGTGFYDTVDTIYIGGGTPTAIRPDLLLRIAEALSEKYAILANAEVTVECNPATIDLGGLKTLRKGGINRISIGLQSADNHLLKQLGRIHTYTEFENCFHMARSAGFENISVDLMFGLPDQTMELWEETLEKVTALQPEHLSCYSLKVEEGTPFYNMDLNLPDDDLNRDMYDRCVTLLTQQGYARYEISNFSRPGMESRHNEKYWQCDDFVGFGSGAYSCRGGYRYANLCGIDPYIMAIKKSGIAPDYAEPLSEFDRMSEFMFLGLRMANGISYQNFKDRFGKDLDEIFGWEICQDIMRGLLLKDGDRLRISPNLLYVSNSILTDFV